MECMQLGLWLPITETDSTLVRRVVALALRQTDSVQSRRDIPESHPTYSFRLNTVAKPGLVLVNITFKRKNAPFQEILNASHIHFFLSRRPPEAKECYKVYFHGPYRLAGKRATDDMHEGKSAWTRAKDGKTLRYVFSAAKLQNLLLKGLRPLHNLQRHDGNTARFARRSDEVLGVRVILARIAPSILDLESAAPKTNLSSHRETYARAVKLACLSRRNAGSAAPANVCVYFGNFRYNSRRCPLRSLFDIPSLAIVCCAGLKSECRRVDARGLKRVNTENLASAYLDCVPATQIACLPFGTHTTHCTDIRIRIFSARWSLRAPFVALLPRRLSLTAAQLPELPTLIDYPALGGPTGKDYRNQNILQMNVEIQSAEGQDRANLKRFIATSRVKLGSQPSVASVSCPSVSQPSRRFFRPSIESEAQQSVVRRSLKNARWTPLKQETGFLDYRSPELSTFLRSRRPLSAVISLLRPPHTLRSLARCKKLIELANGEITPLVNPHFYWEFPDEGLQIRNFDSQLHFVSSRPSRHYTDSLSEVSRINIKAFPSLHNVVLLSVSNHDNKESFFTDELEGKLEITMSPLLQYSSDAIYRHSYIVCATRLKQTANEDVRDVENASLARFGSQQREWKQKSCDSTARLWMLEMVIPGRPEPSRCIMGHLMFSVHYELPHVPADPNTFAQCSRNDPCGGQFDGTTVLFLQSSHSPFLKLCKLSMPLPNVSPWYRGAEGSAVSLLASHQGYPGSIPRRVTPDFRMWESCWTMPLVGGFSRGSPVSPPFHSGAAPYSPQSPSSALETSMLRAVKISSLTHYYVPLKPPMQILLDQRMNKVMRHMAIFILYKEEDYTLFIQVDLKEVFQKCSFYREQPTGLKRENSCRNFTALRSFLAFHCKLPCNILDSSTVCVPPPPTRRPVSERRSIVKTQMRLVAGGEHRTRRAIVETALLVSATCMAKDAEVADSVKAYARSAMAAGIRASVAPVMAFHRLVRPDLVIGHVLFFVGGSTPAFVPGQSHRSFRATDMHWQHWYAATVASPAAVGRDDGSGSEQSCATAATCFLCFQAKKIARRLAVPQYLPANHGRSLSEQLYSDWSSPARKCHLTNARLHHRGSKLYLRSDLRLTQKKTVAPFEFKAGLEIEIKFISNRRNWRFEISIRDQQPSLTNLRRADDKVTVLKKEDCREIHLTMKDRRSTRTNVHGDVIYPPVGSRDLKMNYGSQSDVGNISRAPVFPAWLRVRGQEARERYGRQLYARLVRHRSYAHGVQCFRPTSGPASSPHETTTTVTGDLQDTDTEYLRTQPLISRNPHREKNPENSMITKSGDTVWHCSSEYIVYKRNSITPLDCQRIKENFTLSEDYEASRVAGEGGGWPLKTEIRIVGPGIEPGSSRARGVHGLPLHYLARPDVPDHCRTNKEPLAHTTAATFNFCMLAGTMTLTNLSETNLLTNSQCDKRTGNLPRRLYRGANPRPSDYKSATLPLSYFVFWSIYQSINCFQLAVRKRETLNYAEPQLVPQVLSRIPAPKLSNMTLYTVRSIGHYRLFAPEMMTMMVEKNMRMMIIITIGIEKYEANTQRVVRDANGGRVSSAKFDVDGDGRQGWRKQDCPEEIHVVKGNFIRCGRIHSLNGRESFWEWALCGCVVRLGCNPVLVGERHSNVLRVTDAILLACAPEDRGMTGCCTSVFVGNSAAEEYRTCIQEDLEQGFQKCSFHFTANNLLQEGRIEGGVSPSASERTSSSHTMRSHH
ncbi:hypothetical protein PR048_026466 [Dryococelus australis]|uniref:Uncharacterized protein n=1 Tax=Dryococelus australis TaxID=614101 RepID=A0ABQ9GLE5_9NEOP|nr:hypothetical protein PR048_026466 [Dryococelus australis]